MAFRVFNINPLFPRKNNKKKNKKKMEKKDTILVYTLFGVVRACHELLPQYSRYFDKLEKKNEVFFLYLQLFSLGLSSIYYQKFFSNKTIVFCSDTPNANSTGNKQKRSMQKKNKKQKYYVKHKPLLDFVFSKFKFLTFVTNRMPYRLTLSFQTPFFSTMSCQGTVKSWTDSKGFGFIVPKAGGADVFVHRNVIGAQSSLVPGKDVSYDFQMDGDRAKATSVSGQGVRGGAPTGPGRLNGVLKSVNNDKGYGFISMYFFFADLQKKRSLFPIHLLGD